MARVVSAARGFVDSLRIYVKGGTGGNGMPTRGGVGGRGGNVVVVGDKKQRLIDIRKRHPTLRFVADSGEDARLFCLLGPSAKSTELPVPVGVSVLTDDGYKLGEIVNEGDKVIVAKGGDGGSPVNGYSGQLGQIHSVKLDLKLIADVGFVGFPNAGKSTLLKALSRAKPKIASYPFTTIKPNVGVMEFKNGRKISLADLPGLIEGAHANVGMGHKFLKHVERTKVLLFVVDLQGFQLGPKYPIRSAIETIFFLNKELELYREDLMDKPAILALNKTDLPGAFDIVHEIKDMFENKNVLEESVNKTLTEEFVPKRIVKFDKIIPISAKHDTSSLHLLKEAIRNTIDVNADLDELKLHQQREALHMER